MAKRKKKTGCLGTIIALPFSFIFAIFDYAIHYKPTPIVGSKKGRKKKKWF